MEVPHTELSFASEEENTSESNTAVNEYPRFSAITATQDSGADILSGTNHNSSTRQERTNFVESLPTRVQVKLNQPFGNDNLTQCFKAEACFRHVLLPLYKSAFLEVDPEWQVLAEAMDHARVLLELIRDHHAVDCRPLQGYQDNWEDVTRIEPNRVRMATDFGGIRWLLASNTPLFNESAWAGTFSYALQI